MFNMGHIFVSYFFFNLERYLSFNLLGHLPFYRCVRTM